MEPVKNHEKPKPSEEKGQWKDLHYPAAVYLTEL